MQLSRITKRRLAKEIKMLENAPIKYIQTFPNNNNLLEWYFLIQGPEDSQYKGGYYLGKIIHAKNYPFAPPNFIMLTPSGRFMINKKICTTATSYHKSEWDSSLNMTTLLVGFLSIFLDDKECGISHIKRSKEERAKLAKESITFNKKVYPKIMEKFHVST